MANPKPAGIARVERSIFSAKSLFAERPKWAGQAPERKFFRFDKGDSLEAQLAAPLGSFHLLCLMAIIAEAQARPAWQKPGGSDRLDREMRMALGLNEKAAANASLALDISYYRFAACIGRPCATVLRRRIDQALLDLAGARCVWRNAAGGNAESSNIIAFKKFARESGTQPFRIAICPALSDVIKNQRPYTRVSMDEIRSLKHPSSILLHGYLSSVISPGKARPVGVGKMLEGAVWAEKAEPGSSTWRSQRSALLRKLLPDLENAGWQCDFDPAKDQVAFKRPRLNGDTEKEAVNSEGGPELSMSP